MNELTFVHCLMGSGVFFGVEKCEIDEKREMVVENYGRDGPYFVIKIVNMFHDFGELKNYSIIMGDVSCLSNPSSQ